ncbi:MAG TPA: FAD-binding oxidoreductase [Gemmatimonadales bacterium]|nr:FAD-binding oxidoreductase [Gemmatimonadales bacterium]
MSDAILMRLRHALGEAAVELAANGQPRATPDSSDGIALVCGLAHEQGWRVRVEGQGTWMPGDAPADLALSTRGLARIVDIAPADLVATVEAGVPLALLQRELDARGAWLALDPPGRPERSLGSAVATGTAGPLRHGFGGVRDHILGGSIVTGDGRAIKAGGSVVKNVAGYDLTKLQVGGFGAFGVITQLHLRLRARPAERVTLLARGERDLLSHQARTLMEKGVAAAALELLSPALAELPEWVLALEIAGTGAAVAAEVERTTESAEVAWTALPPGAAGAFWSAAARGPESGELTFRLGVFPDGLDEMIDLLAERLDTRLVSAGPGRGLLRWSGTASLEALRTLRRVAAEREIPLTLERAPWPLRHAFGHFGAYREGVGRLVAKLRSSFDPDPTFAVALEGTEHG